MDIAVASAVASYVGELAGHPDGDTQTLRRILRDAVTRLQECGYDHEQARAVLIRRVGRFGRVVPPGLRDPS